MSENEIKQFLEKGIAAHEAGDFSSAELFYNKILALQPKHPLANHNLGIIYTHTGRKSDAVSLFDVAINSNPEVGQFWCSLIETLLRLGKHNQAQMVMDTARSAGASGKTFDNLSERISSIQYEFIGSEREFDVPSGVLNHLMQLIKNKEFQEAEVSIVKSLEKISPFTKAMNVAGSIF